MIIPLPETITSAMPIIGDVYTVPVDIGSTKLRYLSTLKFFKIDKQGFITDVSGILNAFSTTVVSFDSIEVSDQLIAVVPAGASVSKLWARCTVAGSGFTLSYKYWSSTDSTFKPLTVTDGSTFLRSTGLTSISFTEPADMGSLPIGRPGETFYGRPIYIEIATVSAPASPTIEQMYPINATYDLVDITDGSKSLGISVPAVAAFPVEGDTLCLGLDRKFSAIEYYIWKAQVGGTRTHKYYDASGADQTLAVTDPTNGLTRKNEQAGTPVTFTATASNASASTAQGISSYGSVFATVDTVPTAATHRKSIGLSSSKTGTIEFELRADFTGGVPAFTVYESGVLKYTGTLTVAASDKYSIMRERHHDNTTKIYYLHGDVLLYTTTVTATTGVLYGRVGIRDSGAKVKNFRMADGTDEDWTFIGVTLDNVTGGTSVNEAQVTQELPYRRQVTFTPPSDWTANTTANAPTGSGGANKYHVCVGLNATAEVQGVTLSHILLQPTSGIGVTGLTVKGVNTVTKAGLRVADKDALQNAMTLTLTNVNAQLSVSATFAAGLVYQEVNLSSFAIGDGQSILVSKTSGDAEVISGIGSYLSLT